MRIRVYWLSIFCLLTVGAFFFYQNTQPSLTYAFAPEFDGNDYTLIYNYFAEPQQENYEVPFPFNGRVLVPWLASTLGSGDIIKDFQWINLVFTLLSVIMLFLLWRMLGFEPKWFWGGFFWLIFHWTGMVRLNAFDPITVDLPLYFFQTLFIWLLLKRRFWWLLLLGPIAVAQKESFIALLAMLCLYAFWHNHKTREGYYRVLPLLLALGLSLATKWSINLYFPPLEEGKGAIITLLYHARETLLHPFKLVRWLLAVFVAFGPAFFVACKHYSQTNRYDNTRNLLLLFSTVYLSFGILAGGDITRIVFLGFPFIATWIMYELREMTTKKLWLVGLLSLPLMMIHTKIPNPAFQWGAWQNWYPEFAETSMLLTFAVYLLISVSLTLYKSR